MNRRGFMASLATAAAARWEADGYDPENIDNWEPMGHDLYTTVELEPESIRTMVDLPLGGGVNLMNPDLNERGARVYYDSKHVVVATEERAEDLLDVEDPYGDLLASTGLYLTAEQAREFAVGLWQAAEEQERRGSRPFDSVP